MKHKKLSDALTEISDEHIAEAAAPRKRRYLPWISAVAAVLALAILTGALWHAFPSVSDPTTSTGLSYGLLTALPQYPDMAKYSENNWDAWWKDQKAQYDQPDGYADGTETFFRASIQQFLTSDTQNQAYSPINVYMALAMLAESTSGDSRQQILDLLGSDSIESLRTQADHLWNAHYCDDGLSTSILANSLWLDSSYYYNYNMDTVNALTDHYYASVFQQDLGSEQANKALRTWLNDQTGGLLKDQVKDIELSPNSTLALVSTLYYQVQWVNKFYESQNTQGVFHASAGDINATFMNREMTYGPYYWGEDFGAVRLSLEDGSCMWLVLPDEGCTPADILKSGYALDMILGSDSDYPNQKSLIVNLSVPKFDIASDTDLIDGLKQLGVTDVFSPDTADFSSLITDYDGVYVNQIKHAARVAIDEEGVTAAAFTLIERSGAGMPPQDKIDFTLDRPFLFIIESQDGIPLFAGIVNEP